MSVAQLAMILRSDFDSLFDLITHFTDKPRMVLPSTMKPLPHCSLSGANAIDVAFLVKTRGHVLFSVDHAPVRSNAPDGKVIPTSKIARMQPANAKSRAFILNLSY